MSLQVLVCQNQLTIFFNQLEAAPKNGSVLQLFLLHPQVPHAVGALGHVNLALRHFHVPR